MHTTSIRHHLIFTLSALLLAAALSSCSSPPPPPPPPPPPSTQPGAVIGGFKMQKDAAGNVIDVRPMSASETKELARRKQAGGAQSTDVIQLRRN